MPYRIERVDPADAAAVHEWFEVYEAAGRHDRGDDAPLWLESELLVKARRRPVDQEFVLLVARDTAGRAASVAEVQLPLTDNTHTLLVDVHTDPDCRRRGAGSALLAEAERMARAASRTTLMGEVTSGVDGTPRAAHWFAAAHGFVESLPETRRDLALPVDDALLDALEAEALAKAGGYHLVTYVDAVPSELLQGRARLAERIATDAPMGELDWREERWDTARVRRAEAEAVEMGRRLWATAAIAPDGSMAGVSGLSVSMAAPDRVFQWDTVVDREHRGHRLGLLLKVVNLRVVQRACRQARRVITWNASDNTHMVSINERMGYVPAELEAEWQKRLT